MALIIILILVTIIFSIFFLLKKLLWSNKSKLKEGMRLEAAGKMYEALSIYDYLLKEGHSVPELRWKIANISMKINNIIRAQKELSVILQTGIPPENVSILEVKKLMAETYIKSGKIKEAFLELIEIYNQDSENPTILFQLALIYAGQRLPGKAIRLFEKCLASNPNDYELNYYIAKAYLDFGNPDKALEYLEKTIKLRYFDNGKVNYYLGILYFSKKQYDLAMQNFSQVLKLRPNDNRLLSEAHHYIALCYKEKGLIDEAVTNFEKSQIYSELLPKDFQNIKSLYNQGVLLYKSGQYQKALEKFYKVKLVDYKYKDIDKIIKEISIKLKSGAKINSDTVSYINDNPLINILKRGILFSKYRFNITAIESQASQLVKLINTPKNQDANNTTSSTKTNYDLITSFNNIPSKSFKETARKLIKEIGFNIKSEPRFMGDDEYIDGNAINFFAIPLKNPKIKKDVLITIRRYKEMIPELSVSRFLDWFEENNLDQGIFIGSNSFSSHALKVIHTFPNVKFIDKNGLYSILRRIQ